MIQETIGKIIAGFLIAIGLAVVLFLGLWWQKVSIESTCNVEISWKQAIFMNLDTGRCDITKGR